MFKIKKYIPDIVVAIILIAGIGLLAYPTIGDYINAPAFFKSDRKLCRKDERFIQGRKRKLV